MLGTEKPVQEKIVRDLAAIGWTPVRQKAINELRRGRMGEAIVEPLLVDALRKLNPELSETDALQIADALRRVTNSERFLEILRDGLDIALDPERSPHITVVDWLKPGRNDYVVTDEFALETGAVREPRVDVVCLVNGLPLGLIETKAFNEDWKEAVSDFEGYWVDAPELERFGAVCVATNGFRFRCAPTGARGASSYAEWKDTWPHAMPAVKEGEDRELEVALLGFLDPHNLADVAANFVVFETRKGLTKKKLARYQQFRGANKLVRRVLDSEHDRGVIWHTQGSGKSLTMLFAARKLKNVGLNNPTIFIIIDRRDLDDQINETFTACQFKGVTRATRRKKLAELLATDARGVIITTVQKFEEQMASLATRDNVIALIDEAHRSQEGLYGLRMRAALPNARLFAFTGTPIESTDHSTRKAFAPDIEGKYESYLDAYSPKQAIEDKATVETRYVPHLVELAHFGGDDLDRSFDVLVDDLPDEEQEKVRKDAAKLKVIAKSPERVKAIAEDALAYLNQHAFPQGFKAQFVAVDREACALVADALIAQGMEPEELAVIYSPHPKEDAKPENAHLRHWHADAQWRRLHGAGVEAGEDDVLVDEDSELDLGEVRARKKFIDAFKDDSSPLKLLVVTDMLLTGFDAPVEQVMFLDKPLRGAKLLQAIMRTNRPYPEKGKDRGVIIDYWGVFDRLQAAFAEFSPEDIEMVVLDLQSLKDSFPVLVAEALALVAGMPKQQEEYDLMMWLLARFMNDKEAAELFEERFQAVQSAYETLAPDPALVPHLDEYRHLVRVRALWRRGARLDQRDGDFDVREYRPQTHALVQDAVSVERLRHDLPVYRIDGEYLKRLEDLPGSHEEKAAEVEAAIEFEIRARGGDADPVARSLAERLEHIRRRKQEADADMLSLLEGLVGEYATEKQAHEALGLSERAQGFLLLTRAQVSLSEGDAVALARRLDQAVEAHATVNDWHERDDVRRDIRAEAMRALLEDEKTRGLVTPALLDELMTVATVRQAGF